MKETSSSASTGSHRLTHEGLFTPSLISSSSLPHLFLISSSSLPHLFLDTSVFCSAANMRNLISVAVILHVAFTAAGLKLDGKEVEFGDMIAYKPEFGWDTVDYQHYATFVGDRYPEGNTFERTDDEPYCFFLPIDMSRSPHVFNFLDGYVDKKGKVYTKGTETEMKARIEETRADCGLYDAVCNNCEHLATYVRYGKKISLQFNITGGRLLCKLRPECEHMWNYVEKTNESQYNAASSVNPVGLTSLCLIALFLCDMSF
ncbi:uncharacterized protein LOC128449946 isoform X2 [Pleuronectes platessa]|uniref:uncharacterized protein LOC128449946 isoform X2 n=1 Tax=Pleuronectes platessa TaxID=8262 RepID=UPI00232A21F1|nr:uncharacterized protein LOC128449946 isoform X2 [Pleuronectes platessa]